MMTESLGNIAKKLQVAANEAYEGERIEQIRQQNEYKIRLIKEWCEKAKKFVEDAVLTNKVTKEGIVLRDFCGQLQSAKDFTNPLNSYHEGFKEFANWLKSNDFSIRVLYYHDDWIIREINVIGK